MKPEEKQHYLEKYKEKKAEGELFFPNAIAKDAVVSLGIFILLISLVVFVGVPSEPPANPNDTSYIPRPEWYFLWMFQALKYFPGQLESVAILGLGAAIAVGLFGLPFFDRGAKRHPRNRPVASVVMSLIVVLMVALTIQAVVTTPPQAEGQVIGATPAEQIQAGSDLFAENCAKCHGADGEGAELPDSPGQFTRPLNSDDVLVPFSPDTLAQIISYGQPGEGMQAFGVAYGGPLTDQQIRAIVAFMESWAAPPETAASSADLAALAKIENPSFATDVKPILDKKCSNCHAKRVKGGLSLDSYDHLMTTGDHTPVLVPGDAANSILAQMLRGVKTDAGGQMPPGRPLAQEQIDLIERWINQGAQNN